MPNRSTAATTDIPIKDLSALRKQLKKTEFSAVEAAPAFLDAYDRSPAARSPWPAATPPR